MAWRARRAEVEGFTLIELLIVVAIIGVGATRRLSAVKWGVAGTIVWAWVLTIPLSAAVAAVMYFALRALF